jgi:hypothetical protein
VARGARARECCVDDTANWEFAAVVAAVCIGLGGLLLFTLIGAIGSWRMHDSAARAAEQAARASDAMQELARAMMSQAAERAPMIDLAARVEEIASLRRQAEELLEQQARLQDAVRHLVEAGVLRGEESGRQLRELEQALGRVEEHLVRITTPGLR